MKPHDFKIVNLTFSDDNTTLVELLCTELEPMNSIALLLNLYITDSKIISFRYCTFDNKSTGIAVIVEASSVYQIYEANAHHRNRNEFLVFAQRNETYDYKRSNGGFSLEKEKNAMQRLVTDWCKENTPFSTESLAISDLPYKYMGNLYEITIGEMKPADFLAMLFEVNSQKFLPVFFDGHTILFAQGELTDTDFQKKIRIFPGAKKIS